MKNRLVLLPTGTWINVAAIAMLAEQDGQVAVTLMTGDKIQFPLADQDAKAWLNRFASGLNN